MADTYTVQRTTVIAAPPEQVYAQINDFHRWTAWSPWEDVDPDLKRTYSGPDAGQGATYAWSGNRKAGQGRMKITEAAHPSKVVLDLDFEKPFASHAETVFTIEPAGAGSQVTWTMTGRTPLLIRVLGMFISMDKLVGKDFEKGLAGLKATSE